MNKQELTAFCRATFISVDVELGYKEHIKLSVSEPVKDVLFAHIEYAEGYRIKNGEIIPEIKEIAIPYEGNDTIFYEDVVARLSEAWEIDWESINFDIEDAMTKGCDDYHAAKDNIFNN